MKIIDWGSEGPARREPKRIPRRIALSRAEIREAFNETSYKAVTIMDAEHRERMISYLFDVEEE